jgi:Ca-activated chloride channel homolog
VLRDILVLVVFGLGIAQAPHKPVPAASEQPVTFSVTADLVLLDVSVKAASGEHVSGLTKDDFRVYENGKVQVVSHFANEDTPVTAGLVIDMSGSMRTKHQEVVTAALAFIGASNRGDEIFVVHFSDNVSLGLPAGMPFTGDVNQLRAALSRGIPQGRTALNDAVVFSLGHLEQGTRDRRALVLVSDGGDNSSVHRADDVRRRILESRATVYAIGIHDEAELDRNPRLLRQLARVSGGEAFLGVQLSAVNDICLQIARDIRTRYSVGYVPVRSSEHGSVRKIKVTASTPGGRRVAVRTRTSYVLPPSQPPVNRDDRPGGKRGS